MASETMAREPAKSTAPFKDEGLASRSRDLNPPRRRGTLRKDLPDSEPPEQLVAASMRAANRSAAAESPVLAGTLPTRPGRMSETAPPTEPPAVLAGSLPAKPVQPALAAAEAILKAHETAAMEAAMARAAAARASGSSATTQEPATASSNNPIGGSGGARPQSEPGSEPNTETKATPKAAPKAMSSAAAPSANTPPRRMALEDLQFLYRPMWSVRTNMLAISTCLPAIQAPSGELIVGEAVMPPAAPLEFIEKLDRAVLQNAINDCMALVESGRGTLLSVPVHAETLTDKDRRASYLEFCRALPTAARRRLIFECLNIDRDADHGQFVTALMNIKPYATLLLGQLSLRSTNFAMWKRAGLGSVGVDMTSVVSAGMVGEAQESRLIGELQHFAFQATQHGLRPYVRGLNSLSLAAAAVSAGFDFIDGVVIRAQARPMDVQPFTLEDLYRQYAVARRGNAGPSRP